MKLKYIYHDVIGTILKCHYYCWKKILKNKKIKRKKKRRKEEEVVHAFGWE